MNRQSILLPIICCVILTIPVQAQTVQSLKLVTNHIIYERVSGMIYASLPSSAGTRGNSIATIDPGSATILRRVFIGSEPNVLAASDDGQFLYAGLDGAHAVRRYTIATHHSGLQFSLGYNAEDIKVLPGASHSIAIAGNFQVGVYDNGVQRPNVVSEGINSLAFSNSAAVLFGVTGDSPSTFFTLSIDSSGVSETSSVNGLLGRFGGEPIIFDPNTGLIDDFSARSADPNSSNLVGTFAQALQAYNFFGTNSSLIDGIVPDTANGRVFFLISDQFNQDSSVTLAAFDPTTFLPISSLVIPNVLTPGQSQVYASDLVPWGSDGLAFRTTDGKIWLINGRTFPALADFQLSVPTVIGGGPVTGTVTLSRPAPAGGAAVRVASSDNSIVNAPANVTIPAGETSASFSIPTNFGIENVTVTAAYGVQSINRSLQVVPSAGVSLYPANVRVIQLTTNDLVFNPVDGLIYASVPSSEIAIGNSITAIRPFRGDVGASVFVGSEPSCLAISDDGAFIYAGLSGAAAVRRFDPPTRTAELQFSLGSDSFFGPYVPRELVVLPGEPHTLAVSRLGSFGGVSIYDDGVVRPNVYAGFPSADSITAGATPGRLYAYDNEDTGFAFSRFNVDSDGITLLDSTDNLISGFGVVIVYQSGLVFSSHGEVVNAEARTLAGTFTGQGHMAVLPDVPEGKVYFLDRDDSGAMLSIYNLRTFIPIAAFLLPGVNGNASSLVKWKTDHVAFRTDAGQVFLVNATLPVLSNLTITPRTVVGGTPATGAVNLSNVAPEGGIKVTLVSSNSSVVSVPKRVTVPAGARTVTFDVTTSNVTSNTKVTITANYKNSPKSVTMTITP